MIYLQVNYFRAINGDIFEYCVGERKTFSEDESKNLTRQLALALEFIHSKYIVHLDVKPQNILLSKGNVTNQTNYYDTLRTDIEFGAIYNFMICL